MIVPLIFDVLTYKKEDPVYSWVFYRFVDFLKNGNGFVIANEQYYSFVDRKKKDYFAANCRDMEYTFPKNSDIQASQKYQISNLEMDRLVTKYETPYQMMKQMVVERDEDFEDLLSSRLDAIELDSHKKIEAILLWVGLKSVYEVAQKRNIKVIVLELSSIRKPNYNTTLGYFSFQDKYDRRGCKDDYYEFVKEYNKKPFPLLSRKELLSFFVTTDELYCLEAISSPEPYELGISPGLQQDYFFDNFANEPLRDTLKKIKTLFDDNRVSVRFHPRYQWKLPNKKWAIDRSKSSFDWILKCRRIVTSISNVGFEAMLLGKTAYVLSDYMPYSFMAPNHLNYIEDEIVSIQFLNYMLFSYFVPWKLIFDMDYIQWRLTDPSPVERFHRHYEYLCREKGIKGKVTFEKILQTVHHLSDEQVEYFKNLNPYQRNCEREERLKYHNLELQQKEEQLNFYKKELYNIQNSTSWKVTAPLRDISRRLKK